MTGPEDAEFAATDILGFLRHVVDRTTEDDRRRVARAAKAMDWHYPGRPPFDDRAALAAVKGMIDAGEARSVREASLTVAKLRAKGHAVEAMAERLRRKFRKVGTK